MNRLSNHGSKSMLDKPREVNVNEYNRSLK